MKTICGVYKITCLINDKIYIGSSNNIKKRWKVHKNELNKNNHDNMFLQRDWNRFGEKNFIFEVLEECKITEQYVMEQKYLDELQPFYKDGTGYNINKKACFFL